MAVDVSQEGDNFQEGDSGGDTGATREKEEFRSFLKSQGINDDIISACQRADYGSLDLFLFITNDEEINGFIEDIKQHTKVNNLTKVKLKKAIKMYQIKHKQDQSMLSKPNAAFDINNMYALRGSATYNGSSSSMASMKSAANSTSESNSNNTNNKFSVLTKEEIDLIKQLSNQIKLLESKQIELTNTLNAMTDNRRECETMINEVFKSLKESVDSKSDSIMKKFETFFNQANDGARIGNEINKIKNNLEQCKKYQNQLSNSVLNNYGSQASKPSVNEIQECLKFSVDCTVRSNSGSEDSKENNNDNNDNNDNSFKYNKIEIGFNDHVIKSIVNKISCDLDINLFDSVEIKNITIYVDKICTALDKISSVETGELPTIKEIKMMFPELNIQHGCIALGKDTDLYLIANEVNPVNNGHSSGITGGLTNAMASETDDGSSSSSYLSEYKFKKCFFPDQNFNKAAIFGDRAKKLYLAILIDIYHHFTESSKYNNVINSKLSKYFDVKGKKKDAKSILYEILYNVELKDNTKIVQLIKDGEAILGCIRNGQYRLTNEELKFLQLSGVEVDNAIYNIRNTKLLLILKEKEQLEIPYIQEKKAVIAIQKSTESNNGSNKTDENESKELVANVEKLRKRESDEISMFRNLLRLNTNALEKMVFGNDNNDSNESDSSHNANNTKNKFATRSKSKSKTKDKNGSNELPSKDLILKRYGELEYELVKIIGQCYVCMNSSKYGNCILKVIDNLNDIPLLKEFRRVMICYGDPKEKYGPFLCNFKYSSSCPDYCTQMEYIVDQIDQKIEKVRESMLR